MSEANNAESSFAYLGQHLRGVDKSRRVMLPSEWRVAGAPTSFTLLPWPFETLEYLLILPPERWSMLKRNLTPLSLADEGGANLERFICRYASQRALDQYGRLPLPEDLAKLVEINGEAQLVGRMSKFEIWSPARLEANLANPETRQRVLSILKTITI